VEVAPALLGKDPRHCDRINQVMDESLAGHPHVKAALDVACWDIFGKATNMPICDLLGGCIHQRLATISSIYAGDPADMRTLRLLPANLDFVLEAPCANWQECLAMRKRTNVPIFFDELAVSDTSVSQIIAQDAAEGIGFKISKNGGLTQCRRQRDIAIAAGLVTSVQGTVGSEIAFAAIVHLAQTIPEKYLRCILDTRDMVSTSVAEFGCVLKDGGVLAPSEPGLGVTVRIDVLGKPV